MVNNKVRWIKRGHFTDEYTIQAIRLRKVMMWSCYSEKYSAKYLFGIQLRMIIQIGINRYLMEADMSPPIDDGRHWGIPWQTVEDVNWENLHD